MSALVSPVLSNNKCASADAFVTEKCNIDLLGCSLQQCVINYNNLVTSYKKENLRLKNKIESKTICEECTALSQVIAAKDNIIKSVAATLTKLQHLENVSIAKEIFLLLNGYEAIPESSIDSITIKDEVKTVNTPNKGAKTSITTPPPQEKSVIDQSASEIEGTPTGRSSPILNTMTKTFKNGHMPESKIVKLNNPTSSKKNKHGGKLKQLRLNVMRPKTAAFVDLSISSDIIEPETELKHDSVISLQIESMDSDDTIPPSPTSGPIEKSFKNGTKNHSPSKFLKSREKSPNTIYHPENIENDIPRAATLLDNDANESINLLQPQRSSFKNGTKNGSPSKFLKSREKSPNMLYHPENIENEILHAATLLENDANESINLLQPQRSSERKLPLYENINGDNVPVEVDNNIGVPLMKPENIQSIRKNIDTIKKEQVERVYREPAERRKAEKRKLPGWNCDECQQFYDVLYKDNPEMQRKLMLECSKHRGRQNPARPKTPPGFWQPRWTVEEDTEAFNRQNNAV